MLAAIDAAAQPDESRSATVRRLIEAGLREVSR
jgi:hypothetical protein